MAWTVKVTDEYAAWFTALIKQDLDSATQVAKAVPRFAKKARRWVGRWWTGSRPRRSTISKSCGPDRRDGQKSGYLRL